MSSGNCSYHTCRPTVVFSIVSLFLGERSISENNYFQVVLFLVKEWCLSWIVFRTDLLCSFIHSLLHIIVILNLQFIVAYGCQWFEVTLVSKSITNTIQNGVMFYDNRSRFILSHYSTADVCFMYPPPQETTVR